ncbi:MAG TPA: hypothetical protein VNO82_13415 [Solirubrobacteraceae bacterium]|nr:hypothetical protein [Solirubrobacteraceae bacterium]
MLLTMVDSLPVGCVSAGMTPGASRWLAGCDRDPLQPVACRTGDAGSLDGGYLYLADRLKDMIISGGENVYSIEVENVIAAHPGVREVAVVARPDERWGERVHAIVVPEPGAQLNGDEIVEHCRPHIAGFKLPRSFEFRDEPLPKTGAGKILRAKLRAPAAEPRSP